MKTSARLGSFAAATCACLVPAVAWGQQAAPADPAEPAAAQPPPPSTATSTTDTGLQAPAAAASASDPTGGAYTTPTLLFIPAGAVPVWNVRVIASTELQSSTNVPDAGFRPGLGAELGLPAGFTLGAGTNWVGGDVGTTGKTDFNQGLSPYAQLRFHLLGDASGQGFQLGTSVAYKFVGFEGDPGETELAISAQYRRPRYELGLQGVVGQDFGDSRNHDGEGHAYALYRVIPELGLGVAGQFRAAIAPPADAEGNTYDLTGGGIASLTLGHYQLGALVGASTLNIDSGKAGALAQVFGTARF